MGLLGLTLYAVWGSSVAPETIACAPDDMPCLSADSNPLQRQSKINHDCQAGPASVECKNLSRQIDSKFNSKHG